MKLIELDIQNICECKHALLKMHSTAQKSSIYVVNSNRDCEIITLSLQLICGTKYSSFSALSKIKEKICNAKVKITFTLPGPRQIQDADENYDHSSDSDVPCTSRQARQRLLRRLENRSKGKGQNNVIVVKACRDFTSNPDLIVYNVNGGPTMKCSVIVFQIRFFTCTDLIFPRLINITHGDYCNGKWLDLLSTEYIEKESGCLLTDFCKIYAERKTSKNEILNEFTTSVLTAHNFLNISRISHLINIFNDIRWLFEYITCSELTVWFLLPTIFGNLQDISKITIDNINFDLMETKIQLKQTNDTPFPWTQAEKHIQELLMVAVQLAFGYHCQQNIIYLHNLNHLEKHQSFEFLNYSLLQSSSVKQLLFKKNYFRKIVDVCSKLNICCVLEYCSSLPFYPNQTFVINCNWLDSSKEWQISFKEHKSNHVNNTNIAHNFLQKLDGILK